MESLSTSTIQAFQEFGSAKTTFLIVSDNTSFEIKGRLDSGIRFPGFIIIELGKAERGEKRFPDAMTLLDALSKKESD